ncbi:hypothetical protein CHLRE_12g561500v5 [Chlamydomonas reinhardtii]|uniref:Uncharacterized protein n=1 Tax=Chlamydomonas reinhardtii TaxID=3055 RepID=A8JHN0_CHLRE|nr:uncharacterized protein CHLRE_12g561500v5 [Chlamydomonas reinhardtii]PNW75765.1 hypothetical protein CHLRE_12g561500v5 [Chlamydomonas reinhardtii]|eukprot:XP_001703141.1 predicted protein [Chlamydomonas reinhardtii]
MLSWKDEEELSRNRPGSMTKPARSSIDAIRQGSMPRGSLDRGAGLSPVGSIGSPGGLKQSQSLLRGPGHAAEGTIGSEGWWHHASEAAMNEAPKDEKGEKVAGFVPMYNNIPGLVKKSIWDEEPAASAPAAAGPPAFASSNVSGSAFAAPAAGPIAAAAVPAATEPAAPAAAAAAEAPAAAETAAEARSEGGAAPPPGAKGDGWWTRMDNGILNQPPESAAPAPGAVVKGERVMGGGFVPQFGVAGGNAYKSIFAADESKVAEAAKPVEKAVADWAPFTGAEQQAAAPAATCATAVADDDWSGFASAPKVA